MKTILFLCPYGGAKSVMAASYFNREAARAALPFVAVPAAAETPYGSVPPPIADYLESRGFSAARSLRPRSVEQGDIRTSHRVVSIDCDLSAVDLSGATVERWDDVPKVSEDLPGSAQAIEKHVRELIEELTG